MNTTVPLRSVIAASFPSKLLLQSLFTNTGGTATQTQQGGPHMVPLVASAPWSGCNTRVPQSWQSLLQVRQGPGITNPDPRGASPTGEQK